MRGTVRFVIDVNSGLSGFLLLVLLVDVLVTMVRGHNECPEAGHISERKSPGLRQFRRTRAHEMHRSDHRELGATGIQDHAELVFSWTHIMVGVPIRV